MDLVTPVEHCAARDIVSVPVASVTGPVHSPLGALVNVNVWLVPDPDAKTVTVEIDVAPDDGMNLQVVLDGILTVWLG